MTNIVLCGGMRKDPKVGGGVGRTREVAKNRTPILTKLTLRGVVTSARVYVATLQPEFTRHQCFGSSYVAKLWLKLCSNALAQDFTTEVCAREKGMNVSTTRSLSILKGIVPSWIGDLMSCMLGRQGTTVGWLPHDRRPNVTPFLIDDPARGKRMVTDCKLSHYFRLGRVDPNLCASGGVDVYVLESGCGKSADRVVAVGDLCKVSNQASGMGPMSAKKVRTLLRKRDRRISIDMRYGVPHSLKFENDIEILNLSSHGIQKFREEKKRIMNERIGLSQLCYQRLWGIRNKRAQWKKKNGAPHNVSSQTKNYEIAPFILE
ncbi:hypothetical protein Lal_00039683 [Lupinus albus]|nr:hypothetical protein Lal_00039683 [Lupinus albus]